MAFSGELVALHLYDVGASFDMARLERALAPHAPKAPAVGKGTPPYVEFPRPLVVPSDPVDVETPQGRIRAEVTLHFYAVGAVSVRFRLPLVLEDPGATWLWDECTVRVGEETIPLAKAGRRVLERDRARWSVALQDRYTQEMLDESYNVFAFTRGLESAEQLLPQHERAVAGLLRGEDGRRLHESEVQEALKRRYTYYQNDVAIVDWDAAFIYDPRADYEDLLFILEIANLQLLEYRAYDEFLDDAIERAYDDLEAMFRRPSVFRNARRAVHELSLLRIEISELADAVENVTKFLGDWYLARLYQGAKDKFHVSSWQASVDDKLSTINKLYMLANEESDSRRMIILEALIVLLFIVDLAGIFFLRA